MDMHHVSFSFARNRQSECKPHHPIPCKLPAVFAAGIAAYAATKRPSWRRRKWGKCFVANGMDAMTASGSHTDNCGQSVWMRGNIIIRENVAK